MIVKPLRLLIVCLMLTASIFIVLALVIGDHLPGGQVHTFTDNSYKTHSMYVFDTQHGIYFYTDISGHEDELPGWSTGARGVVYYPRKP
jgi:hypothetical protein